MTSRDGHHRGVKIPSRWPGPGVNGPLRPHSIGAARTTLLHGTSRRRPGSDGGCEMADLAYAVLLIGGFAVLVLMLRGLDSL